MNQAAAGALLARLEAQKAICDSAERDLHRKYKQRDELEKQIRPEWEQARKRSRMDDALNEEKDGNLALCLPENDPNAQQETKTNDASVAENGKKKAILYLPETKSTTPLHKELRRFLEEEQTTSGSSLAENEKGDRKEVEGDKETNKNIRIPKPDVDKNKAVVEGENGYIIEERLDKLEVEDGGKIYNIQFPFPHEPVEKEDEESIRQRGKGNIEKWLQFLLENTQEEDAELNADQSTTDGNRTTRSNELIKKLNLIYPLREIKVSKAQESSKKCTETAKEIEEMDEQQIILDKNDEKAKGRVEVETRKSISNGGKENRKSISNSDTTPFKNPPYRIEPEKMKGKESISISKGAGRVSSPDASARREKIGKEKELVRSESARAFRRIPSSPSLILEGMKRRVDCMRKKPLVLDDNDEAATNSFIKSSIKTIKRAVRI